MISIGFLGTAGAIVSAERDNSSLVVSTGSKLILVDCPGNPVGKLLKMGFDPGAIDILLLTHFHTDHCYGVPALLFHYYLEGRTRPLWIAAPEEEFEYLPRQIAAHDLQEKIETFQVQYLPVPATRKAAVWNSDGVTVHAAPGEHGRAVRAYRIDGAGGESVVVSGDTRPVSAVASLAENASLLVHEASFREKDVELAREYGHSTARQAGEIAAKARAHRLALVHYDLKEPFQPEAFIAEARDAFSGEIIIPGDLDVLTI